MFSYFILLFSHKTSFLLCIFAFILSHSCFFYCFLLHRLWRLHVGFVFASTAFFSASWKGNSSRICRRIYTSRSEATFFFVWIFSLFHKLLLTLNVVENEFVGLRGTSWRCLAIKICRIAWSRIFKQLSRRFHALFRWKIAASNLIRVNR